MTANPPCLIINADDLGYSPAVNRAVVDLHRAGRVTSASLLVNLPHSEAGAAAAVGLPDLSIGVHLNLSKGRPLLSPAQIPSLVDPQGLFWNSSQLYRRALLGLVNWAEAEAELDAQVDWACRRGLAVDNLDTHVHFHLLPAARRLIEQLAARYDVAAWRSPDVLATLLPNRIWTTLVATPPRPGPLLAPHYILSLHQWGERVLTDPYLAAVLSRPGTVSELIVHPGYADDPHLPLPDQLGPPRRQVEVDLLASDRFAAWLDRLGLQLISFASLGIHTAGSSSGSFDVWES